MIMPALRSALLALAIGASSASAAEKGKAVLDVGMGESIIQKDTRAIARVLLSDPSIAELRLLEEGQYQLRGLAVGSTDLWVWYRDDIGHPVTFKVVVSADMTDIARRVKEAVPTGGDAPRIYPVKDRIVVEGEVDDLQTLERIAAIARIYDPEFVNLLSVKGDHQVQLRVVFAEVNRTGLRELGINLFTNPSGMMGTLTGPNETSSSLFRYNLKNNYPNISEGLIGAPGAGTFNLVAYLFNYKTAALLSVLEQQSIARTLAKPTLTALSGQQAEFMAGGEIPIPVSQTNNQISIEFKEYGVKLVFVPTVLSSEVIDMRAYVEVSEIDPSNGVRLSGIEIPAISIRKGESHLRLGSGMTFAMAGMLSERTTANRSQIPLLGDIPLIGSLFRYVSHERAETELVIFVTPELVRPLGRGEVPAPPGTTEGYNPSDLELFLLGSLNHGGSRTAEPTGAGGMYR